MKLLQQFVIEYKDAYIKKDVVYENSIEGEIRKVKDLLLDDDFLPSVQLKSILDKFIRRARYPMEVAITGQFSAGKSTFLNAYKLKITYKSGAEEYYSIDAIADFTDQRKEELEEVKYLTLYAPMDILKDISFVDTPGLNSQSQGDTETTRRVLRDVGGIIWLTLIDNAGKMSEAEVLEEYMQHFKNKSLCVLNQKDKFTNEQIQTTTKYIKNRFNKYFAEVIPISAKQALDSRKHQKNILLESAYEEVTKEFKNKLNENLEVSSLDFFSQNFEKT
jgi:small GTP-binding protein